MIGNIIISSSVALARSRTTERTDVADTWKVLTLNMLQTHGSISTSMSRVRSQNKHTDIQRHRLDWF